MAVASGLTSQTIVHMMLSCPVSFATLLMPDCSRAASLAAQSKRTAHTRVSAASPSVSPIDSVVRTHNGSEAVIVLPPGTRGQR